MLLIVSTDPSRGYWFLSHKTFMHLTSDLTVNSLTSVGVKTVKWDETDFNNLNQHLNNILAQPVSDTALIIESSNTSRGYWFLHGETFIHLASPETVQSLFDIGIQPVTWDEEDFISLLDAKMK